LLSNLLNLKARTSGTKNQ